MNWMVNFNENWDFLKIITKIVIFEKLWSKSIFSTVLFKIKIWRQFGINLSFFKNFVIRQHFWKFWIKSWFSKFFDINQNVLYIPWPKLRFSKILTKIDVFFKVFTKINSFERFDKHRDFSTKKISKVEIFREFRTDLRYFIKNKKNRDCSTI